MGCLWSRRPIKNLSSHSVLKSSHLVIAKISKKKILLEIAELSNLGLKKIFHQKNFFSDFVKFRYGLSMESNTSKKSSLALSFKILALSIEIYGLLLKIFALSQFRYWPSMEKKANGKSILALSFEIFAPKIFFTDIVKFHYGLSMKSKTNKKSIVALSFEIIALGHSQNFKKKNFVGNCRIIKFRT